MYDIADNNKAFRQQEILSDVHLPGGFIKPQDNIQVNSIDLLAFTPRILKYAIIVSQDCDLEHDFNARQNERTSRHKLLRDIILCELETKEVKIPDAQTTGLLNSRELELVKNHRHERLFYVDSISADKDANEKGLPLLIADFKLVYGIDAEFLYFQTYQSWGAKRHSILSSPYKEHFSQKYYAYHNRIGLPENYKSI